MRLKSWGLGLSLIAAIWCFPLTVVAQQSAAPEAASTSATTAASSVPQLLNYSGLLTDINGKPLTNVTGVTLLLYKDQQGGAPLWMETQNVHPDKTGHYSVTLGSTTSQGVSQDVFVNGEARWLAVQIAGQEEQPRVLLVAVPYALKAADAETIGGLPASAFVLANGTNGTKGIVSTANATTFATSTPARSAPAANPTVTGKGVVNFVPMWDTTRDIVDSLIFQKNGNVGVNTTAPAATLDVNGETHMRDTLTVTSGTGDGIDISPRAGFDGIYVYGTGQYGVAAYGGYEGGYFNGPVAGSYSVNTTDSDGSAAAYGYEFGSTHLTYGVVGHSASNYGVGTYGQAFSGSQRGMDLGGSVAVGVWGDTGSTGGYALFGTADDGLALFADNNSSSGYPAALFENDEGSNPTSPVLSTLGFNGGQCNIDVSGDLSCTGSKSAVVPVDGGVRKVALYAVESPENWFEDFGSGLLSNGAVSITLEPTFRQTVNTDTDYYVFLTANGDSRGLYVAQKTPRSFEVREQGGGTSSVAFDYRIVARRKGYEKIRLADKTKEMNAPRPKRVEGRRAVLPTELDKRNTPETHLHASSPVQPVVNRR